MSKLDFTLPKTERLKSKKTIEAVFAKNQHIFLYPFKVFFLNKSESSSEKPKVLFSVSKRNFKKAVDRNWIRRRSKEAYRLNKYLLTNENLVFQLDTIAFIYVAKNKISFEEQEMKMRKVLVKLKKASQKLG